MQPGANLLCISSRHANVQEPDGDGSLLLVDPFQGRQGVVLDVVATSSTLARIRSSPSSFKEPSGCREYSLAEPKLDLALGRLNGVGTVT